MNKVLLYGAVIAAGVLVAGQAAADDDKDPPNELRIGGRVDVGAPSGATASLVVSPKLPWLQVGAGVSYNYMSEGLQVSAVWDPMPCVVGLTLGGDVGGFFPAKIPNVDKSPTMAYTYEDAMLGLRFGKRNHFNFLLAGGASHIDLNASNFSQAFTLPTGTSVGDPHVSAWTPALKFGLQLLF